jgi:hypothetical protein
LSQRGYRWTLVILAGAGCAVIAGLASGSFFLAGAVFAVIVSAAVFVESN